MVRLRRGTYLWGLYTLTVGIWVPCVTGKGWHDKPIQTVPAMFGAITGLALWSFAAAAVLAVSTNG